MSKTYNLREEDGFLSIHPLHLQSIWEMDIPIDGTSFGEMERIGRNWIESALKPHVRDGNDQILLNLYLNGFADTLWVGVLENVRLDLNPMVLREDTSAQCLRQFIGRSEGFLFETKCFLTFKRRDVDALSSALRDVMLNEDTIDGGRVQERRLRVLSKALFVVVHDQSPPEGVPSYAVEIAQRSMAWCLGDRMRAVFGDDGMITFKQSWYDEDFLRKIHEAFPWLIPNDFLEIISRIRSGADEQAILREIQPREEQQRTTSNEDEALKEGEEE